MSKSNIEHEKKTITLNRSIKRCGSLRHSVNNLPNFLSVVESTETNSCQETVLLDVLYAPHFLSVRKLSDIHQRHLFMSVKRSQTRI